MNLWAVFVAGLLAGATTCAASQGGLLVGLLARQKKQAAEDAALRGEPLPPSSPADDLVPVGGFLLGKLLVLTLVGALLGALGALVDLDARIGGLAQLLAGGVMVVLALSMLGVPGFRDIVIAPPTSWLRLARRSTRSSSAAAPFALGLATVLIPCGVTISIMLLAAASGSALRGAATMAVFVVGTAPMFVAMGFLTQRYVGAGNAALSVVLGAVVLVLGLVTVNAGLVVLGSPVTAQTVASSLRGGTPATAATSTPATSTPAAGKPGAEQVLYVDAQNDGFSPGTTTAKAGVPTKLVFRTQDVHSCILWIVVPSKGLSQALPSSGETTVDLGTLDPGETRYACSMGMYTGSIVAS
jgi:sulfite exporter TauE/SafE